MKRKLFCLLTLLLTVCSGAWADDAISCSANLSTVTSSNKSSGSVEGTNCTLAWSAINSTNVEGTDGNTYWKFDGSTYVKLTLNSGSYKAFQAGDVLTVKVTGAKNKTFGFKLKSSSGNGATKAGSTSTANVPVEVSYTLVAADIEDDGSIKIFRNSSEDRYFSFSVTGTRAATPSEAYTVSFNAGEHGTYSGGDIKEASAGAGITLPEVTDIDSGYFFTGWFTSEDEFVGLNGETYKPSDDITLYAHYSEATAPSFTTGLESTYSVAVSTNLALSVEATGVPSTITYAWTVNGSPVGENSTSYTFNQSTPGSYTVVCTASNGISPNATTTATVTVNPAPFFAWRYDSKTVAAESELTATGGTVTLNTTDGSKSWATESASYNAGVEADMKATGDKGLKSGANALYLQLTLSGDQKFKAGDEIYISGYNVWDVSATSAGGGGVINDISTGSSKTDYNVGHATIPASFVTSNTLYITRGTGSGMGIAAIKVVRPVDTTAPVYVSSNPAKDATDVVPTNELTVTYSEDITIVDASKITLKQGEDDVTISSKSASGNVLTVTLASDLAYSKSYTLTIAAGALKDESDNVTTVADEVSFTTMDIDEDSPVFVSSVPANDATGVAVNVAPALTYDETLVIANSSLITLKKGEDPVTATATVSGTVLTVTPSANLENNTEYTLTVGAGALADLVGNATTEAKVITFTTAKAKLAAPTINGVSFFKSTRTVTITSIDGATITYSTDGESYEAYPVGGIEISADATIYAKATHSSYSESDAAIKKFKKFTNLIETAETVSALTTWDWSANGETVQLKDDGTTFPYKGETADIVAANFNGEIFAGNASWGGDFNANALVFSAVEYPTRDTYYQGQVVKFTTTVPGTVQVWYSNTSAKEVERFLNINGTEYGNVDGGHGSKTATIISTPAVSVSAGLVTITGVENHVPTYVHIEKIVFTPATTTVTTNAGNWASFTPEWNCTLEDGAKAYIITGVNESTLTGEEVAVLEGGKGYFIKGEVASHAYTATATDADATSTEGNLVVGCATNTEINGSGNTKYILGTNDSGAGLFYVDSSITIPAGKAYLDAGKVIDAPARALSLDFEEGETTAINATLMNNERMNNEVYNLNGQRVAQPTKGLYIVNGRKVVIR